MLAGQAIDPALIAARRGPVLGPDYAVRACMPSHTGLWLALLDLRAFRPCSIGVWITALGAPQRFGPTPACRVPEGNHMEANADRFLELIHQFEDFSDAISPERAHNEFDETTLQLFWMRWPQLSSWAGSLWRMLSEELSGPSAPHV